MPLGETAVTLCVLRDTMGMPRLACATDDDFWWKRRQSEEDDWEESASLTAEAVMTLLRRHNVLGAAPEPLAMDEASLADELRRTFHGPRAAVPRGHFEGERTAEGVSASPGRAAGLARLGAERRDPRDLQGTVLVAAGLDPKDAPCLLSVAAVVATGGGILSHLGLLAVESGKPAVIVNGRWDTTAARRDRADVCHRRLRQPRAPDRRLPARRAAPPARDRPRDPRRRPRGGGRRPGHAHAPRAASRRRWRCTRRCGSTRRPANGLERAGDDEVLVARGHHLRTRHQVEKAIARVTDPAVVRFAAEEILLAPAWAVTDRALRRRRRAAAAADRARGDGRGGPRGHAERDDEARREGEGGARAGHPAHPGRPRRRTTCWRCACRCCACTTRCTRIAAALEARRARPAASSRRAGNGTSTRRRARGCWSCARGFGAQPGRRAARGRPPGAAAPVAASRRRWASARVESRRRGRSLRAPAGARRAGAAGRASLHT